MRGALNEAVLDASAEDAAKLQAVIDARAESLAALQEDSGEDGYYSSNLPQSVSDNAGNGYYQNEAANSTTDIEEIVEQAPTSIVPDIDFSDIESAAASISSVSTSDAEIDIDMSGLIDIAPSAALADSYKAAQADMDELSGGGDKPLVSLDLLSLFSETDDVEAEIPSEADGNKIMSITTRWLTQDQFDGKDDSRLNLRPTGSTFSVKAQIDTQLSGQHEYAVGDIQITISKSVFADRNGNSLGRYSFSVPAAPDNRAQFAYSEFSDYFVLVNTKVIPAATSMRFEFSIDNISSSAANGNHTDLSDEVGKNPTSPLDATISVTTHKGTLIQMKSDSIDAIIDTSAQVTSASVVTQNVSEVWDTSYPASLRPDNDEDYIYIHWQAWCYVSGFQWAQSLTFSTELSGDGQGIILGASLPNGKIVRPGDENTTGNSAGGSTPAKLSPISLYDNYYIGTGTRAYVNIYAAYLKSELPVEKDKTKPQPNYQMSNRVEYTLTSLDDKQITVAGDTEVEHYSPIEFPDPEGHFNVFKYGGNSYPHALNNLSRHKDQEVEFCVMTVGFGMPWTAEEDTVPTSLEDYGKREYKMITEDYATQFNHRSDDLTETDFEFSALRFVAPQTYEYKRFTSSGYAYTERNGVVTQQWVNAGGYGYVPSSGKNLTFTVYGRMAGLSDEWIPYATVKFTGGVSSITPLVNGVSQLGNTVVFPPMTTDYKVEISTSEPAVIYNMYPTVKVKASNSIINQVNALFDGSDIPETYVRNWAKSSNYVTGADGKDDEQIVDCGPKAADDTLRGVGTAATLSKTCSYENDEALGQVKFRYTATAEIASNITELDEYNQAVREGLITRETHGVFYDLLPEGVEPDTTSVTTRKNDVIESVETYPNWRGSNRTMMIVNVSETPTPVYSYSSPMNKSGYADKPSISFDAYMPWEMLYKYGNSVRNIVAYESGNDKIGTVKSFIGEPDDPRAGYNSASISAVSGAIDYMDDLNPDRDTQSFLYASCTTNAEVNTSSIAHISKKVSVNNSGAYTDGLSNEYPANVAEGGVYNYLVSVTATAGTVERDIVFYDNLENYIPTAKDDKDDDGDVQWRGRLTSIDTTMLAHEGIAPKVYYSTREGLVLDKTENTSDRDLSNSDIWKEYSDDLSDDVKAQIKAIAVDASTMQNGEDYDLSGGSTIGFKVNMIAPTAKALAMRDGVAESEITKEIKDRYYDTDLTNEQAEGDDNGFAGGAHAYNSIIMDSTHVDPISGVETPDQLVWFTYTKVGLFQQPVEIRKTWNDDANNDGLRPDSIIVDVKNGKTDEIVKSVGLSAAGDWKATLDDLDIYDSDGNIIDYDISERVEAPEMDISENYTLAVSKGSFGQSYTITLQNTHVPENVEFKGKKIWAGENGNAAARPQTVKIDLYSNGEFFGTYDVDVSGDGSEVEYVVGNLPKYTNGVLNVYSAKENIASAYEDDNYYAKSFDESTGTLVNEYYPYGSLKIEKKINNKNADKIGYQQKFKFQVEFIDKETGAPDSDEMNYRIYSIDGNSISDELSLVSGENIELAGNEYALFDRIPTSDKYRISEVDIPIGWYVQGSDTVEGALTAHSMKTATFENRYIAGGSFPISIRKSLAGQQLRARTFTFVMKDENGRVISTARNDVNGIVDFGIKSFTEDNIGDEHKYYISELHENDGVYNYVDDVLEIVLNIKDAGAGELNITPAFNIIADNSGNSGGDSQIELIDTDNDGNDDKNKNAAIANFTNIYDPQGSIQLKAFKRLEGGELHDGQFEFVLNLVDTDGNTIEEKGRTFNDADGNIVFPELKYSAADNGKEYRYKITEIPGDDNGFVYSEQEFFYNVKVYDGYDGKMYYTTQVEDNADLTFVNEAKPGELVIEKLVDENSGDYDANTEFEFEVKLDGPNISDGQFSYELDEYGEKKIAFAVYSETDNSLMFYNRPVSQVPYEGENYNGKVATNVYLNVDTLKYLSNPNDANSELTAPWIEDHQNDITKVTCVDEISPIYMDEWFALPNMSNIDVTKIDTSRCVGMHKTFYNASKMDSLDLSTWNTQKIKYNGMSNIFVGCSTLQYITFGEKWTLPERYVPSMAEGARSFRYTSNWTNKEKNISGSWSSIMSSWDGQNMAGTYTWELNTKTVAAALYNNGSKNAVIIDKIGLLPEYVTVDSERYILQEQGMINDIQAQKAMPLWNAASIRSTITSFQVRTECRPMGDAGWFKNMSNLLYVNGLEKIDTSSFSSFKEMFRSCSKLTNISGISNWNVSNVTNLQRMFYGCTSLQSLDDLRKWDTQNVKIIASLFSGCSNLTQLPGISEWYFPKLEDMNSVFRDCKSLKTLDLSGWMINSATTQDFQYAFEGCSNLETLDISGWVMTTTPLPYSPSSGGYYTCGIYSMFSGTTKLKTIYASGDFAFDAELISNKGGGNTVLTYFGPSVVGGRGSKIDNGIPSGQTTTSHWKYCRIDGGPTSTTPGIFTYKAPRTRLFPTLELKSLKAVSILEKEYSDEMLPSNTSWELTFDANGGVFNQNQTENTVQYYASYEKIAKYSHSDNLNDSGEQQGDYKNNLNLVDIVTIPGADKLHVSITYSGESIRYDWACVWEGAHADYNPNNDWEISISNKLGDPTRKTIEYEIDGDSVTFGFHTDSSGGGYGYYAVIEGTGLTYRTDDEYTEPVSDYDFLGWSESPVVPELVDYNQFYEDKTLYAVWDKPTEHFYDIVYKTSKGNFTNGTNQNKVSVREVRNLNTKKSMTSNINDDGTKTAAHEKNQSVSDTITIPGANKLKVTVRYATYNSTSWLAIYDDKVDVPSATNYSSSVSNKLYGYNRNTGAGVTKENTYIINGNTVKVYFQSGSTISTTYSYGYYMTVEDIGIREIVSGEYEEPSYANAEFYGWGREDTSQIDLFMPEETTERSLFALWYDDYDEHDFAITYDAKEGVFPNGEKLITENRSFHKLKYPKYAHTSNLNDKGEKIKTGSVTGYNKGTEVESITLNGAKKLKVTVKYQYTSSANLTITDGDMNVVVDKIPYSTTAVTKTYYVDGSTARFVFSSTYSHNTYLGYYAIVEDAGYIESNGNEVLVPSYGSNSFYGWSSDETRYYSVDLDFIYDTTTLYASYVKAAGESGGCCWDIDETGTLNLYPKKDNSTGTVSANYSYSANGENYTTGSWAQYAESITALFIDQGVSVPSTMSIVPGTIVKNIRLTKADINIFKLLILSGYNSKMVYKNASICNTINQLSENWNNLSSSDRLLEWNLEKNNCYIEYSGNGGTGASYLSAWNDDTLGYQVEKNIFDMDGYTFSGYSTKRLASPRDTIYQPGDMLSLSMKPVPGEVLTLYAQWTRVSDNMHEGNIEEGVMRFTMRAGEKIMIKDLPAGTTYRITEVNSKSGWSAVSDKTINATGVIPAGNQATATFTNTYQSGKITVPLSGIKFLDGEPATSRTPFEFQLERLANATDNAGEPVGRTTSGVGGAFSFEDLEFSEAGTYNYIIREIVPDDASGILYDEHVERITIVVSADNNNMLSSTVTYMDEGEGIDGKPQKQDNQIAFYNKTDTTPANLRITKNLDEPFSTPVTFSFRAVFDNPSIEDRVFSITMPANTTSSDVSFNDFPIGERFTIVEENTPGFVLVSSENDILTLSYGKDYETSFTNRRDVSGTFALEAQKVMHDRKLNGGEFAFAVFDSVEKAMMAQESGNTGGAIQVSVNAPDLENKVYFDALSVTRPGAYDYYIVEIPNAGDTKDKNIVYDSSIYKAHVIVSDTGDTALECKVSYEKVGDANNIGGAVFDNHLKNGKLVVSKEVIGNDDCTSMFSIQFSFEQYDADGKLIEESEYAWRSKTNENRNGYVSDKGIIEISKDEEIEIELPIGTIYNFVELDAIGYKLSSYENEKGTIADSDTVYAKIVNEYAPTGAVEVEFEKIADGFDLAGGMFSFVILDEDGQVVAVSKNDAAGHISFSLEYDKSDLNENGDVQRTYLVFEQKDDMKDIRFDDSLYNINVVLHDNKDGEIVTHAYVMDSATGQKVDNVQFVNVKRKPVSLPLSGEIGIAGLSIAGMFLVIVGLYLFSRPMIRKEKHNRTRR